MSKNGRHSIMSDGRFCFGKIASSYQPALGREKRQILGREFNKKRGAKMTVIRELPQPYKVVRSNPDGSYTEWARFAYASDCFHHWRMLGQEGTAINIGDVIIWPSGNSENQVFEAMLDANALFFAQSVWAKHRGAK